ncbi:hypothetical protein [Streptomyces paradoxus]
MGARQQEAGAPHISDVLRGRADDLNARFPGLVDLVAAWTPPDTP